MGKFETLNLVEIDAKESNIKVRCIAGKKGLERDIATPIINRPGLALTGFFDCFIHDSIQLFGKGEYTYISTQNSQTIKDNINKMMKYNLPCCIFSHNNTPPDYFCEIAEEYDTPVLISELNTTDLNSVLFDILSDTFAEKTTIHGTLVEVFGIGILLIGKSGIGKSETALELIERGHRFISDDTTELKCVRQKSLIGRGTKIVSHHMEIRGLGIINVKNLYGIGSIMDDKQVELIIELEEWNIEKEYERIGRDTRYKRILGVDIPYLLLPVMPGRNIPVVIETAAMNRRLMMLGINAAQEFTQQLLEHYENEEIKNSYFYNKE